MSEKSTFTADQVKELRNSHFVLNVTKTTVSFTREFKQLFYDQRHNGQTPEEIFRRNGIDPKILGSTRIRGFAQRIEEQATRNSGFSDLRYKGSKDLDGTEQPKFEAKDVESEISFSKLTQMVIKIEHQLAEINKQINELKVSVSDVLERDSLGTHILDVVKKKQAGD